MPEYLGRPYSLGDLGILGTRTCYDSGSDVDCIILRGGARVARAETLTKLPLDRWATIMGINPLHFNQVFVDPPTVCEQPWLQHAWQDVERVGREDIAMAIATAEADIERHLGYRVRPTWEIDEWRPTVRPWRHELVNLSVSDVRGFRPVIFTNWKHFITGGIESRTLLSASEAVDYTDEDSDSYFETATITVAGVTFTDECEASIYFAGHNGEERWEIKPLLTVDITTGTLTVTVRREQLVNPDLWESMTPVGREGTADADFVTVVDVYRKFNDPQRQSQLLWEPLAGICPSCSGTGCASCQYTAQEACLMVRDDPAHGIISYQPATWNTANLEFDSQAFVVNREPNLIRLWYYAGYRDKNLTCPTRSMSTEWERAIAYYAAALLDRPVCECNNVHAWIERWREDLAANLQNVSYQVSPADLDNPFGTRRGAIFAWNRVQREGRIAEPVLA